MSKAANYIRGIEIMSLWHRHSHVCWTLRPDVNILSGVNGVGKSTILSRLISRLEKVQKEEDPKANGVKIDFEPSDATYARYDVIRSFDRPFIQGDALRKLAGEPVITELDWQLFQLQRRYLDYQVNQGNKMIELLTNADPKVREQAADIAVAKQRFQDIVDELFAETGKRIDRKSNEIAFIQKDEKLHPYQLSSGEKQMLVILITVLTQDAQPYVLFMDEPEVSLHVEWQQKLVGIIRQLNPHVQIILTTHSPAVIMDGWLDAVTDVADIMEC